MSDIPQFLLSNPGVRNHPSVGDLQEITGSNPVQYTDEQEEKMRQIQEDSMLVKLKQSQRAHELVRSSERQLEKLKAKYFSQS